MSLISTANGSLQPIYDMDTLELRREASVVMPCYEVEAGSSRVADGRESRRSRAYQFVLDQRAVVEVGGHFLTFRGTICLRILANGRPNPLF